MGFQPSRSEFADGIGILKGLHGIPIEKSACFTDYQLILDFKSYEELGGKISQHLINNRRMFNGATDDLAIKPYIPHKRLLQ